MNPSYARLRASLEETAERFAKFVNGKALAPPEVIPYLRAVDRATDDKGRWRGAATFVYVRDDWTIIEDLSGGLAARGADAWLPFAGNDEFVFAGYNDSICYGELAILRDGRVLRDRLIDEENPEEDLDRGELEDVDPLESWIDIAQFVDEDPLIGADEGQLWFHAWSG